MYNKILFSENTTIIHGIQVTHNDSETNHESSHLIDDTDNELDKNSNSQRKDSEKSDDQMSINSLEWSEYETDSRHTNEENDNLDAGHECSSKIADNKVQPSFANFTEDNSNTTTTLDAESTSNEIPKQKWTRNFSTGDIVWAK
uniref:Uncharacterized protein n=1 Tax=Trichogramma kaykai TaxID=54128 RepID=A0ABD2X1E3_9HYME